MLAFSMYSKIFFAFVVAGLLQIGYTSKRVVTKTIVRKISKDSSSSANSGSSSSFSSSSNSSSSSSSNSSSSSSSSSNSSSDYDEPEYSESSELDYSEQSEPDYSENSEQDHSESSDLDYNKWLNLDFDYDEIPHSSLNKDEGAAHSRSRVILYGKPGHTNMERHDTIDSLSGFLSSDSDYADYYDYVDDSPLMTDSSVDPDYSENSEQDYSESSESDYSKKLNLNLDYHEIPYSSLIKGKGVAHLRSRHANIERDDTTGSLSSFLFGDSDYEDYYDYVDDSPLMIGLSVDPDYSENSEQDYRESSESDYSKRLNLNFDYHKIPHSSLIKDEGVAHFRSRHTNIERDATTGSLSDFLFGDSDYEDYYDYVDDSPLMIGLSMDSDYSENSEQDYNESSESDYSKRLNLNFDYHKIPHSSLIKGEGVAHSRPRHTNIERDDTTGSLSGFLFGDSDYDDDYDYVDD